MYMYWALWTLNPMIISIMQRAPSLSRDVKGPSVWYDGSAEYASG